MWSYLVTEIDDVVFERCVRTEILVVTAAVGTATRRVIDVLAVELAGQSVGTGGHYASLTGTEIKKNKHISKDIPDENHVPKNFSFFSTNRKESCVRKEKSFSLIRVCVSPACGGPKRNNSKKRKDENLQA